MTMMRMEEIFSCLELHVSKERRIDLKNMGITPTQFEEYLINHTLKDIQSNTVIFAFKYNSGGEIVIAADRRMSGGYYQIMSDKEVKIENLTTHSAVAFTGSVSAIQEMTKNMKNICEVFKKQYDPLSVEGQAKYLQTLLRYNWYYASAYGLWFCIAIPILAAYDLDVGKTRIFECGISGSLFEYDSYTGNGCGWEVIEGLIDEAWKTKMSRDEAVELAIRGLFRSGLKSSGVSDARTATPTIRTIDIEGIHEIDPLKIRLIIDKLEKEKNEKEKTL